MGTLSETTLQESGAQMKDDPRFYDGQGASSSTNGLTRPHQNGLERTQAEPEGENQEISEPVAFRGKRKRDEHPNMMNNTKKGAVDSNMQDEAAQASPSRAPATKGKNGSAPNGDRPKSQAEVLEKNAKAPKAKSITAKAGIGQGSASDELDFSNKKVEVGPVNGATTKAIDAISRKRKESKTYSGTATSSTATQLKPKRLLQHGVQKNGNTTKARETKVRHYATRVVKASDTRAIVQAMESMTIASPVDDSESAQAKRVLKKNKNKAVDGAMERSVTSKEEMDSDALHRTSVNGSIRFSENGSPQNLGCGAGMGGRQRVEFRANGGDTTEKSSSCEERVIGDLVSRDEGPLSASGTSVPSTEVCHTAVDVNAASTPTKKNASKSDAHPNFSEAGDRQSPREQETVKDSESIGDCSVAYWEIVSVRQTKVHFRHTPSVEKSTFPVSNAGEVAAGNDTTHTRRRKRLVEIKDPLLETQPNGRLGKKTASKDSNGENSDTDKRPTNSPSHGVNSSSLRTTVGPFETSKSEPSPSISRRTRSSQSGSHEGPLSSSPDLSRGVRISLRSRTADDANDSRFEQAESDEEDSQNPSSHGDETSNWKPLDQTAGVGINRIRITPLLEERTPGSVGHHVVQKLLVQYGVLERVECLDAEVDSKQGRATETLKMNESYGLENSDAFSKETYRPKELERSTAKKPVEPMTDELVHDYKLPPKQSYRSGRSGSRQALPPILLDATDTNSLPKSLQHLDPDAKVDILNRKSGRVLSGGNAVAVKDLPNLLKNHASYEPIVPQPSSGKQ
jgi:hypothetical protein